MATNELQRLLSAGQFDPANPQGWYNARGVNILDLLAMKPMLEAQGKWNPAWDAALSNPAYFSAPGNAEVGNDNQAPAQSLDLSALDGWWLEAAIEGVVGWSIGEDPPRPGADYAFTSTTTWISVVDPRGRPFTADRPARPMS